MIKHYPEIHTNYENYAAGIQRMNENMAAHPEQYGFLGDMSDFKPTPIPTKEEYETELAVQDTNLMVCLKRNYLAKYIVEQPIVHWNNPEALEAQYEKFSKLYDLVAEFFGVEFKSEDELIQEFIDSTSKGKKKR